MVFSKVSTVANKQILFESDWHLDGSNFDTLASDKYNAPSLQQGLILIIKYR